MVRLVWAPGEVSEKGNVSPSMSDELAIGEVGDCAGPGSEGPGL